jgi:hypothetical protein
MYPFPKSFRKELACRVLRVTKRDDNFVSDFARYNIGPLILSATFDIFYLHPVRRTPMLSDKRLVYAALVYVCSVPGGYSGRRSTNSAFARSTAGY